MDAIAQKADTFYCTFPITTTLGNNYCVVKAPNSSAAHQMMYAEYGPAMWSVCYSNFDTIKNWGLKEVPFGTPNSRRKK